jgi:nitrate/TMAO reductase-like tetraheme cytochrome c subunit
MIDAGAPAARRAVRFKAFGLIGGMLLAVGLVAIFSAVEVSSRPQFCGSCHVMKPYYESWRESSHRNVACVECHIAPGVTAEIRKKYEALSMVARYFTGTYGTNPWAEIDDAACLRCHERRLLSGRELFGDVLFDHAAHLSGMRRGKTLRCTSCHSQIVQGSHIAVTATTCILCHFKGQPSNTGTARCVLCHRTPDRVIRRGGLTFNHADVARYGMECTSCHVRPAGSDGVVPRERCLTCHNQRDRLDKYDETEALHNTHVTAHKVDCLNCHLHLQHVGEPHMVEAGAGSGCGSCHRSGHSPQQAFYAGSGGRGVEPMPDPMFLAGVRCEGCHVPVPGLEEETHRTAAMACMSCHGARFNAVYESWQRGLQARTAGLRQQLDQTTAALRGAAGGTLADARHNLDLVVRARGVHNIRYAHALLARAHDEMNDARRERGLGTMSKPWRDLPFSSPCLSCHLSIEEEHGTIFGRAFAHGPHVLDAKLECETCHRPHAERPKDEIVRFTAAGCESCHHKGVDPSTDCLSCHAGITGRKVPSPRGSFDHALHLDAAGLSCDACHEAAPAGPVRLRKEACANCHEG